MTTRYDGLGDVYARRRFSAAGERGSALTYFNNGVGLKGAYARGGLYGRVVDIPADMAMSRGIKFEGDADNVALIEREIDRLGLIEKLSDAARWARLDGCAALLLITDDTSDMQTPLSKSFGEVSDVRVIEYEDISIAPRNAIYLDPEKPNYGDVALYSINILNNRHSWQVYVHESRIIPITGSPLPRRYRETRMVPWCGRSSVVRAYQAIDELEMTVALGRAVLERKQQGVYEMEGLADLLDEVSGAEGDRLIAKRIDLVDAGRSLTNSVVVDKEDGYKIYDLTLNGVSEMINQARIAVSSESGLSQSLLFERTKGGIGDSGNSDLEADYDIAESLQRKMIGPALKRLLEVLACQKGMEGINKAVSFDWPSLWTPTDQQQADTRLKNAQADKIKVDTAVAAAESQLASPEEARNWLVDESTLGVSKVALPPLPEDQQVDDDE